MTDLLHASSGDVVEARAIQAVFKEHASCSRLAFSSTKVLVSIIISNYIRLVVGFKVSAKIEIPTPKCAFERANICQMWIVNAEDISLLFGRVQQVIC